MRPGRIQFLSVADLNGMKKLLPLGFIALALMVGSAGVVASSLGVADQHQTGAVTAASPASQAAVDETGQANQSGDQGQTGESSSTNQSGDQGQMGESGEINQSGDQGQK